MPSAPSSAPTPDSHTLADLTASEILALYAHRSLSPVEVMSAVVARADAGEPRLHALYAFDPEAALAAARSSEARWMRGEARELDGVPTTLKENIATRGTPMPLGTSARPLDPMPDDAPPAARLREAGAIVFAKTTMPDYGMLSSGLSSFHPLTRNPWDLSKNPGGSSAGAGAAAAAGYGPLHLGTDIGGSIRLPAGWCGIVGLKPSLGRIPIDPPTYGRVAGPMTRTVEDAALMMGIVSRPDPRDVMSLPYQDLPWTDLDCEPEGPASRPHDGSGRRPPARSRDPRRRRDGRTPLRSSRRDRRADAALPDPCDAGRTRPLLAAAGLDGRQGAVRGPAGPDPALYPRLGGERAGLTGEEVYEGMHQMMAMRQSAVAACRAHDFVLSPVAPVPAFAAELASPIDDPMRPFEHIGYTVAFNMSEQPAASVNCGYTSSGLPIGLQIVGQRFDDLGVLRACRAFERLRPPQRPWPSFQAPSS